MKSNKKISVLVLTMLALTNFTACGGPNYIGMKPSTDSLGELVNTASGNVHVYPAVKGPELVAAKKDPTATDLTPSKGSVYVTRDDAESVINASSLHAIRQAGYTVSSGSEVPANAEIEVDITLKNVIAAYKRSSFKQEQIGQLLAGDLGKREDSIFAQTFGNIPTGGVITEITFKNMKTGATYTHLVSGADNTVGFGTNNSSVETALANAILKYRVNLVKALEAFQKGILNK